MLNGIMLTLAIILGLVSRVMYVVFDKDMLLESGMIIMAILFDLLSLSGIFISIGNYYGLI